MQSVFGNAIQVQAVHVPLPNVLILGFCCCVMCKMVLAPEAHVGIWPSIQAQASACWVGPDIKLVSSNTFMNSFTCWPGRLILCSLRQTRGGCADAGDKELPSAAGKGPGNGYLSLSLIKLLLACY